MILKNDQTTVVCAQQDRWASYNLIKYHRVTTDVTAKQL